MQIDNNVKNIVKLTGTPKSIKKAMSELIIEDDRFVFESFSPLPDELLGTDPTQKIIPDKDYEKVLTSFKVKMDSGDLEVWESVPVSYSTQKKLISKYGYDNWFDWSMNHWGTKFGPYDTELISDCEFSFYTINATPHTAMVKMSNKYPKIEFNVRYADEDIGYNVGEYTLLNGETKTTKIPLSDSISQFVQFSLDEGITKESFIMAYNIIGDDYHIKEMIYDLSDKEINAIIDGTDKYLKVILEVILEFELVDSEYPLNINKFLLNSAVKTEQYEYAQKLKNNIDLLIKK
tara:strand:- start:526 stop:1398 length:873 start_codon:yes stop_codon:yes gene_type:complete